MADAFNSSRAKVGDLLSTNSVARERIVIPTFQRGYMWKKKHVEAFWQDVDKQRSQPKGADPHFFGPIVTLAKPTEGVIEILDGQQRLATATILFSVIRDIAREIGKVTGIQACSDFAANLELQFIRNEEGLYSLELGETDNLYFRNTIQLDPPIKTKATLLTHRNIQTARSTLYEKLVGVIGTVQPQMDALKALAILKELKQTMISDFVMANIPVTSQEAAFKIFTTLNDRGLRLSPPDLLLSYLMETAEDHERKDVRNTWTQMILKMGTHDIHHFLRHMWVSKYGDLKKVDLFTALKNDIEHKSISSLEFARLCGDECDNYIQLATADENQLPPQAYPFVRAITRELSFHAALPLLLSSYILLQPDDFERVAKLLLVFITRYSIIGERDSAGMEDLLFKLAREVREKVKDQEDKEGSKEAARHVKNSLVANSPDDETIKKAVADLTLDAGDAKYVVTRIARYKQDPEKQITLGETNLEHVYPQNPESAEWGGAANQEKMDPLTWHIGNLTIFGKRANRKAANSEYAAKKPRYLTSKVVMTNEIATTYEAWDESSIKDRATKLAKLVVEIWNFENASRV